MIRNDLREEMASLSEKIVMPLLVEVLEMLAARRAAIFAKELSLFSLELEEDCSRVIKALIDLRRCNTLFGYVTDECRSLGATLRFCRFLWLLYLDVFIVASNYSRAKTSLMMKL